MEENSQNNNSNAETNTGKIAEEQGGKAGKKIGGEVGEKTGEAAGGAAGGAIVGAVTGGAGVEVGEKVGSEVGKVVGREAGEKFGEQAGKKIGGKLGDTAHNTVKGKQEETPEENDEEDEGSEGLNDIQQDAMNMGKQALNTLGNFAGNKFMQLQAKHANKKRQKREMAEDDDGEDELTNQAIGAAKKGLKNKAKKTVKAALSKGLLTALKAFFSKPMVIIIVIIIVVFFLFGIVNNCVDKKEKNDVQIGNVSKNVEDDNTTAKNKEGLDVPNSFNFSNKILYTYYQYWSEKSLYVYYADSAPEIFGENGKMLSPVQYGSQEHMDLSNTFKSVYGADLLDKYEREHYFMLSAESLFVLDHYLNDDEFVWPQQFIQPVAYDLDTFTLKDLAEGSKVNVQSIKYAWSDKYDSYGKVKEDGTLDFNFTQYAAEDAVGTIGKNGNTNSGKSDEEVSTNLSGFDYIAYLSCKYEGQTPDMTGGDNNQGVGKFGFDNRYILGPFIDFCLTELNKDGIYDSFKPYTGLKADGKEKPKLKSQEFFNVWKNIYKEHPKEFEDAQDLYAKQQFYDKLVPVMKDQGIDLESRGNGVKAAVFSIAIRNGNNASSMKPFIKDIKSSDSDEEIIAKMYAASRKKHPGVERWTVEEQDALALNKGTIDIYAPASNSCGSIDWSYKKSNNGSTSTANAVPTTNTNTSSDTLCWPVDSSHPITSEFGPRKSPGGIGSTNHKGMDIGLPTGSPVRATQSGTVIDTGSGDGRGIFVTIDHGNGFTSIYMHNSALLVNVGDKVAKGEEIAKSGNTGASTGPHLHFQIEQDGVPINPRNFKYDNAPAGVGGDGTISGVYVPGGGKWTNEERQEGYVTTAGVWDYGFGSIMKYEKFHEKAEHRGNFTHIRLWDNEKRTETTDADGNKMTSYGGWTDELYTEEEAKEKVKNNKDRYSYDDSKFNDEFKRNVPEKEKDVFVIGDVIVPAGTIKNVIESKMEKTDEKFGPEGSSYSQEYETDSASGNVVDAKDAKRVNYVKAPLTDEKIKYVFTYDEDVETITKHENQESVEYYKFKRKNIRLTEISVYDVKNDRFETVKSKDGSDLVNSGELDKWLSQKDSSDIQKYDTVVPSNYKDYFDYIEKEEKKDLLNSGFLAPNDKTDETMSGELENPTVLQKKEVEVSEEERTQRFYATGYVYLMVPKYVEVPNMDELTGAEYYYDYFNNYETYAPTKTVNQTNLTDLKSQRDRIEKEYPDMYELLKTEKFDPDEMAALTAGGSKTSASVDNDGNAREAKDIYGDSGLASSFNDAEYYDCYIPYNLTCEDIGGYSLGTEWSNHATYNSPMPDYVRETKVASVINYEGDMSLSAANGAPKSYDPDTGCTIYTDANGTQYYVAAIQNFFYYAENMEGFPGFSSENRGQIFDVILTDGTVIHFIVGDANATAHTNGGDKTHEGKPLKSTFDCQFIFSEMKYEQYRHLFSALAGNTVEIWGKQGCNKKFAEKYNIGSGEDKNKIAYYRMYNKKITDAPQVANNDAKNKSWKLGSTIGSGSSSNNSFTNTGSLTSKTGTNSFTKYNLTEDQVLQLARVCVQEQGSPKGAAAEASLMANLFELKGSSFGTGADGLYNYVKTSGWFANAESHMNSGDVSDEILNVVKSVLIDGKRTIPGYIDEHDMISDIASAVTEGSSFSPSERNQYQQFKTKIKNVYGSEYTFYSFPDENSDPFGYTSEANREKIGDAYYDFDTGKLVNGTEGNIEGDIDNIYTLYDWATLNWQDLHDNVRNIFPVLKYFTYGGSSPISLDNIDPDIQKSIKEAMNSWPAGMEGGRKTLIAKAASLINKGVKYSQEQRDPTNPTPQYLDCSAYVSWAFSQIGCNDVPPTGFTATFVQSKCFSEINEKDLVPGDIGLFNKSLTGGNSNHIGIYLGKNSNNQQMWLHCSSGTPDGPQLSVGYNAFKVFYKYTNWSNYSGGSVSDGVLTGNSESVSAVPANNEEVSGVFDNSSAEIKIHHKSRLGTSVDETNVLYRMLSMQDGLNVDRYENIDDMFFIENYTSMFKVAAGKEFEAGVNLSVYFGNDENFDSSKVEWEFPLKNAKLKTPYEDYLGVIEETGYIDVITVPSDVLVAPYEGVVTSVTKSMSLPGLDENVSSIDIRFNDSTYIEFMGLAKDSVLVSAGDKVKKGQELGKLSSESASYLRVMLHHGLLVDDPSWLFGLQKDESDSNVSVGEAAKIEGEEARIEWLYDGNGVPKSEEENNKYLEKFEVEFLNKDGVRDTMTVTMHKKLKTEVQAIFKEMADAGFKIIGGDISYRTWGSDAGFKGTFPQSAHTYGHAFDVNPNENYCIYGDGSIVGSFYKPGENEYSVTEEIINIWKKHGFYWGGDWTSLKDYMHFSYFNH